VEQNSDILPTTPRKLKALLRNLMILGQRIRSCKGGSAPGR